MEEPKFGAGSGGRYVVSLELGRSIQACGSRFNAGSTLSEAPARTMWIGKSRDGLVEAIAATIRVRVRTVVTQLCHHVLSCCRLLSTHPHPPTSQNGISPRPLTGCRARSASSFEGLSR